MNVNTLVELINKIDTLVGELIFLTHAHEIILLLLLCDTALIAKYNCEANKHYKISGKISRI